MIHPPEQEATDFDRFGPEMNYAAGHLKPLYQLGLKAFTQLHNRPAPWDMLTDPNASPLDQGKDFFNSTAGQILYPVRQGEEMLQKPSQIVPAIVGGTVGHKGPKTIDQLSQHDANERLKTLTEKQNEAVAHGQPPDPRLAADIKNLTEQGAHIEKRGEWQY